MRKVPVLLTSLFLSLALFFSVSMPVLAASTSTGSSGAACDALSSVGSGDNCNTKGPSLTKIVRTAINILSFIAGVIAVIMLIVGGLKYITSDGDSNNISSAKKTIIYAIVGLVVVALAQAIVRLVLREAR